ncbi:MAG: glutamate--tRNA ligase, partial [Eggerthellaceae bacterium]|nr:glutamate--tRNA ligase [Eggerthellaceae bacterium]
WAFARAKGGKFILRIEDTDTERSNDENVQIILRAMRWLALDWDEGPEVGGEFGPYFQMKRMGSYEKVLQQLIEKGAAYPCFCTKEEIDAKRAKAVRKEGGYSGYDGTCRNIEPEAAMERIDTYEPHVWRLNVPKNHEPIEFEDAVFGKITFPPDVMDDLILIRTDGSPTYNFANVCDDSAMQISHIIRGDDHLSNTPRQILIYEALELPIPTFAHLPMILGPDGKKLSKRHGATNVEEYREAGYLPDAMVNYLELLGWSLDGETTIIPPKKLCKEFSLDRIMRKDSIFDETKLKWINAEYIKAMGARKWVEASHDYLLEAGATEDDFKKRPEFLKGLYPLVAERLKLLKEIPDKLHYMFSGEHIELDEKSVRKLLLNENSRAEEAVKICLSYLKDESIPWECKVLQDKCYAACKPNDIKPRNLFQPLRVCFSGKMVSPPLFESMELLDRDLVIARIENSLKKIFG